MPIKIITDSISDLPEPVAREYGIGVIPCYVNAGGQSFLDGVELSRQEFYQRLPAYQTPPTTSSPGIGAFIQVYQEAVRQGASEIISLHVAGKFSNLIDIARIAAEEISAVPVTIVDTGQLSLGEGLQVLAAAEAARVGCSRQAITALIASMTQRTYIFAVLDTLEFLRRSGRASFLQASLGAWLDIKPVMSVHCGEISIERMRTRRKAVARMLARIDALGPVERGALVHSHAPDDHMAVLSHHAREQLHLSGSLLSAEVTPAIGTHIGPAAVGMVVVQANLS